MANPPYIANPLVISINIIMIRKIGVWQIIIREHVLWVQADKVICSSCVNTWENVTNFGHILTVVIFFEINTNRNHSSP